MPIDIDEVLERLIPYRLHAVETMALVLGDSQRWVGARRLQLLVDGRLAIEGTASAFINPVLESGVVHCRALLEFLGLQVTGGGLLSSRSKPPRADDIGVEQFVGSTGRLAVVTPQQAFQCYSGEAREAEQALLSVFRTVNKGVAHMTSSLLTSPAEARLLEIASRGVPALIARYLYLPLNREPPGDRIVGRSRKASDVTLERA